MAEMLVTCEPLETERDLEKALMKVRKAFKHMPRRSELLHVIRVLAAEGRARPIGLIQSCWSGSPDEPWMPSGAVDKCMKPTGKPLSTVDASSSPWRSSQASSGASD